MQESNFSLMRILLWIQSNQLVILFHCYVQPFRIILICSNFQEQVPMINFSKLLVVDSDENHETDQIQAKGPSGEG